MTTLDLDGSGAAPLRRGTSAVRWALRAVTLVLLVGLVQSVRPIWPWLVGLLLLVVAPWFVTERLLGTDRTMASLDPRGTLSIDGEGIRLRHESVLAGEVRLRWPQVSAVVVDTGSGRGFAYEAGGRRRYLLDRPVSGLDPTVRPPLLSSVPTRPNVLLLIEPAAWMLWCHPAAGAVAFVGFGTMGAIARPWATPAVTPAVWFRLVDVARLLNEPMVEARHRALTKEDVLRLRYELGDLPKP